MTMPQDYLERVVPPTLVTPEQFAQRMRQFAEMDDSEAAHSSADGLLCDVLEALGYDEGIKVYRDMKKWYS
jgi:hypothetical protein